MEIPEHFIPNPRLRLREQLREVARFKHLSLRTEQTYWEWIRRFIQFHRGKNLTSPRSSPLLAGAEREKNDRKSGNTRPLPKETEKGWRHPRDMAETEVRDFLVHLATERRVAASTQNQALNALVFLYRHVLGKPIGFLGDFERAQRPKLAREVLTKDEVKQLLAVVPSGWL